MKVTILSHNLSSNASMRAYRIAEAARTFADVAMIGPVEKRGLWDALPAESWISTVTERRLPKFARGFLELVGAADGDVLIAVKPHLASFGAALVSAERRHVPVVLDLDDLDVALAPRELWDVHPVMADPKRPASAVYVSLLTRAAGAASAITVASTALQRRFGGTLLPHGSPTTIFDPDRIDRVAARAAFGFDGPTVLFPGTPRSHKGLDSLARAVAKLPAAKLAVTSRPKDLPEARWRRYPLLRLPMVSCTEMPRLLAAADVVAIPQIESEPALYQMPMKVYDAMAMGRPIVASAISDLPRALEGCARLVPPGDVDALSASISELLSDPDAAGALGRRARERAVEKFSTESVAAILRRVLEGVVPQPDAPRAAERLAEQEVAT